MIHTLAHIHVHKQTHSRAAPGARLTCVVRLMCYYAPQARGSFQCVQRTHTLADAGRSRRLKAPSVRTRLPTSVLCVSCITVTLRRVARFSVLDFWGNRQDIDVPIEQIYPPFKDRSIAQVSDERHVQ